MAKADLAIEVELRFYEIKPNGKWRWWSFWRKKYMKNLIEINKYGCDCVNPCRFEL